MSKRKTRKLQRHFQTKLDEQRKAREDKMRELQADKYKAAERLLIDAMFLFKQFHSPVRWRTASVAISNFNKLTTKKDRLACVKDQILMRYLGLGWEEDHHPWSLKGHAFTAEELFKHFLEVVIPVEHDGRNIPFDPPVALPKVPDKFMIGTMSSPRHDLNAIMAKKEHDLRINAKREVDRQEELGLVDQEEYMQETSWPVEKIKSGFKLQICWKYFNEEDGVSEELRWCGGVVERVLNDKSEKYNFIEVLVRWNEDVIKPGMVNPTREKLKKKDYNPTKHRHGAWRADLAELRLEVMI
jgi:hypothetical protein